MRGSVSGEDVGVLQFGDVIEADAQADVIHHLEREGNRVIVISELRKIKCSDLVVIGHKVSP